MSEFQPTGMPQVVPVCPRHPDQVSYVRCQRCERPVCPQCQRPAPVGVQCVDCVAQAAKSMRTARTIFGGAVTDGRPLVTMTIIGICLAVFIGQQAEPNLIDQLAFSPSLGFSEPWRVLTAAFLHSGVTHIFMNMLALWMVGPYLELLLGRARYAALYLLSAIGGSLGVILVDQAPGVLDRGVPLSTFDAWFGGYVGASGAVFGLFGAFLVLNRHLGRSSSGMFVAIAINGVIGFVVPNIAWEAHLGGLVTGVAAAGALTWAAIPERRKYAWPALVLLAVVIVGVGLLKYAGVPSVWR